MATGWRDLAGRYMEIPIQKMATSTLRSVGCWNPRDDCPLLTEDHEGFLVEVDLTA
jgi:hypothetical protein